MTQYNTLNLKLSNSRLTTLKTSFKNETKITLNLSSNRVRYSKDENNFPHQLLLTKTQVSRLRKAFTNNSPAKINLSKTNLHKIGQSGGFLKRLLGSLLKTRLTLIVNVLKLLSKSILIPLALTAAASETDSGIQKKMFGDGFTILIISNEEMSDIIKIVKIS